MVSGQICALITKKNVKLSTATYKME